MVLKNPDLNEECAQHRPLAPVNILQRLCFLVLGRFYRANATEVDVYPASRLLETHLRELLDVVYAHPSQELDFGGRVRFIGFPVKIYSHVHDRDELEEVYAEQMWLWTIGLPEE